LTSACSSFASAAIHRHQHLLPGVKGSTSRTSACLGMMYNAFTMIDVHRILVAPRVSRRAFLL
jgi:hypothetical protein